MISQFFSTFDETMQNKLNKRISKSEDSKSENSKEVIIESTDSSLLKLSEITVEKLEQKKDQFLELTKAKQQALVGIKGATKETAIDS